MVLLVRHDHLYRLNLAILGLITLLLQVVGLVFKTIVLFSLFLLSIRAIIVVHASLKNKPICFILFFY